ncbi:MAG: alpha/beta fold hydrolase [Bacteroidetes bacterium]|jgi:predicted alpha/beta-fold hydrolase|nr:alpha/beta fold hydrolase [Bacteroidota bacterium]
MVPYQRERWNTPDGDFIDIDFLRANNKRVIVLGHGLEGSSTRPYMRTAAKYFFSKGWDVIAWNSRSCSGQMNKMPKLYSHGDTADLDFVLRDVAKNYDEMAVVGFSMGGAIILNWLGRQGKQINLPIRSAVAISAPCDIRAASRNLEVGFRKLYGRYFLKKLKEKVKLKAAQFPGFLNTEGIDQVDTWLEFDERFSAPLNGLANADEFYSFCSARERLDQIQIPTLLLSAWDDPILSPADFPKDLINRNEHLVSYFTPYGGHVGFLEHPMGGPSYAEKVALRFIGNA